MIRNLKAFFLRGIRKLDKVQKSIIGERDLTDEQKTGIRIFETGISLKDADIFICPVSETVYIEIKDVYLVLDGYDLHVINGKYQYDIRFNETTRIRMKNKVIKVMEIKREEIKRKIRAKSKRTLNTILSEMEGLKEKDLSDSLGNPI